MKILIIDIIISTIDLNKQKNIIYNTFIHIINK